MACRIADNLPLQTLLKDIGSSARCHSYRKGCVHGLPGPSADSVLGTAGAAIGYCQALFQRVGTARQNTERVAKLLGEIGAPWSRSHELFWGHRGEQTPTQFVNDAAAPLLGDGRVPILITGLNAGSDAVEINEICCSKVSVAEGETVLLRVVVSDATGMTNLANLMQRIVSESEAAQQPPVWWPLIQGDLEPKQWASLKCELGSLWKYANVAMNPFFSAPQFDAVAEQITVAQVPVGLAEGVGSDSRVTLHAKMGTLTGARGPDDSYLFGEYVDTMLGLDHAPTLIVLGPSHGTWTDEINQRRVAALLPLLFEACEKIWGQLSGATRNELWRLAA